jgi:hypothetical protein
MKMSHLSPVAVAEALVVLVQAHNLGVAPIHRVDQPAEQQVQMVVPVAAPMVVALEVEAAVGTEALLAPSIVLAELVSVALLVDHLVQTLLAPVHHLSAIITSHPTAQGLPHMFSTLAQQLLA